MSLLEILGAFALFIMILGAFLWSIGALTASVTIEK